MITVSRLKFGPDKYARADLRDKISKLRRWTPDDDVGDVGDITAREWCAQARVVLDEVRELCDRIDEAEELIGA